MRDRLLNELIPLTQNDCFTVFSRTKTGFDFPLHTHDELELNFILNGSGVQRVIGNHMGEIGEIELVLVGPQVPHAWFTHKCQSKEITEVTIQFQRELFDEKLLNRNQLAFMRRMLEHAGRGILFATETARMLESRLLNLNLKHGFDSVLELFSILHDLSVSRNMTFLSEVPYTPLKQPLYSSRRIKATMEYLYANYDKNVTLKEVARLANMTETAFSRFFKQRTGSNFIDCLNDIRLGHASRLLIETTAAVSEIAYDCGFSNMANFNRIFKRKKMCTPKQFRDNYHKSAGVRVFI